MAVKRTRERTETHRLGFPTLYRDDLEQIAEALAEVGSLSISCGDWELTDPSDFSDPDLPERLSELRMTAKRADSVAEITVMLGRDAAQVLVTKPDTLTLGALNRIELVCSQRRRWLTWFRFRTWSLWAGALIAMALPLLASQLLTNSTARIIVSGFGTPLMAVLVYVTFMLTRSQTLPGFRMAILINAYRADRPTFWQRTRDDWAVESVMLTIGLVLGGVIGYFVNQIT